MSPLTAVRVLARTARDSGRSNVPLFEGREEGFSSKLADNYIFHGVGTKEIRVTKRAESSHEEGSPV